MTMRYKTIKTNEFSMRILYLTDTTCIGYALCGREITSMVRVGGKHLSNPIPRKYMNKARFYVLSCTDAVRRGMLHFDRRTQYYINSGTDCDGVSSSRAVSFPNAAEAERQMNEAYQWADGPEYFTKCTKEQYEEYEATWRDYGMEAYEDGHPHCRYG